MDLYGEIILDHYRNPHHHGRLEKPTFSAKDSNPLCGDSLEMDIVMGDNRTILDIGFMGEGCAISQAGASMLTDALIGKTLDEAGKITNENVYEMMQVTLTPARVKCALLGLAVLKKGILRYKIENDQ